MDTKTPSVIPDGIIPSNLELVQPPDVDGISWRFMYRLRGDRVRPGDPLYDEKDAIQVRIRPDKLVTAYSVWFPGAFCFPSHQNRYGDLEGLVVEMLTRHNLVNYAKWLSTRYATQLESLIRRDSGL